MAEFDTDNKKKDRAIVAGVCIGRDLDFNRSMHELEGLCEACDMEVVGSITQSLERAEKGTYMGSGKVAELADAVATLEATMVVFNDSLTPSQLRNLSDIVGCAVMDRSTLILEIFGRRATTREAQLQVAVASLQYMLPRLVGLHEALSRQGGGSGAMSNKGAGETKLELDRRRLEARLTELRRELKTVSQERETQRKKRSASGCIRVALVGYTNAGKSTLLNGLIDLDERFDNGSKTDEVTMIRREERKVMEKDMLFATLDTTVRRIEIEGHQPLLVSDTVGFIDKLPHHLVEAFSSTLEEACEADVLLHVIDASDEDHKRHIEVTNSTLDNLGAGSIPTIYVYNKADRCDNVAELPLVKKDGDEVRIYLSAKRGIGLEALLDLIEEAVADGFVSCELLVPFSAGSVVSYMKENAVILNTEYLPEGTKLSVKCSKADFGRYNEYVI